MRAYCHLFASVLSVGIMILAVGCGGGASSDTPELGQVTGKVTLDGQPVVGAMVVFSPADKRDSAGTTDQDGEYKLYFKGNEGATIGKHTVTVSKMSEAAAAQHDEEGAKTPAPAKAEPQRELVPAKYNSQTTLSADVKAGSNTCDFALTSK